MSRLKAFAMVFGSIAALYAVGFLFHATVFATKSTGRNYPPQVIRTPQTGIKDQQAVINLPNLGIIQPCCKCGEACKCNKCPCPCDVKSATPVAVQDKQKEKSLRLPAWEVREPAKSEIPKHSVQKADPKKYVPLLAAQCCENIIPLQTKEPPLDWSGDYHLIGQEVGNENDYDGLVRIRRPDGEKVWQITMMTGKDCFVKGIGQEIDGKLCIGWDGGGARGSTVYERTDNGLKGSWVSWPGNAAVNSETLTRIK